MLPLLSFFATLRSETVIITITIIMVIYFFTIVIGKD